MDGLLTIDFNDRGVKSVDFGNLLMYCKGCGGIHTITFIYCLPPVSVGA